MTTSNPSLIKKLFSLEKSYILWFWLSAFLVMVIEWFWFFPESRHLPIVQNFELVFLRHPYSPLEIIQQFVIFGMIWLLHKERTNQRYKGFHFFRIGFLIFLYLVFIEELSWGQIFYRYQWPDFMSDFMGPHIDVHNVMLGYADISDLIEACAATFICVFLVTPNWFNRLKAHFGIPPVPLTKSAFWMLFFSFLISPFAAIREVNEQDIIFENAIFATITMGLLTFGGKLNSKSENVVCGKVKYVLWLLMPLPWFKFFYLVKFGHYPFFNVWP